MNTSKRLINILLNDSILTTNENYQRQLDNEETATGMLKHAAKEQFTEDDFNNACKFLSIPKEESENLKKKVYG